MAREAYNRNYFIGQQTWLDKIEDWANEPRPGHRLWSIVSPPGTGKSWLISEARERLQGNQSRCVFWLNMSLNLAATPEQPFDDLLTNIGKTQWIQAMIDIAQADNRCGNHINSYRGGQSFGDLLDNLVENLCHDCEPDMSPILLVDGYDEISDRRREWFEKHLFERFLSLPCTRLLLTRRDEFKLGKPLRNHEEKVWLEVLDENTGGVQCQQLLPSIDLEELLSRISPYRLTHVGLNAEIMKLAVNKPMDVWNCRDLRNCLNEIIRPNELAGQDQDDQTFELLTKLAHLGGEFGLWKDEESPRPPHDPLVDQLFQFGLVHDYREYRKVGDGIREFVQALKRCNEQGSTQVGRDA